MKILLFAFAAQHAFNVSYNGALSSVLCQIIKTSFICLSLKPSADIYKNTVLPMESCSRSDVTLLKFVITFPKEMRIQ